jgi:hypothetical protein
MLRCSHTYGDLKVDPRTTQNIIKTCLGRGIPANQRLNWQIIVRVCYVCATSVPSCMRPNTFFKRSPHVLVVSKYTITVAT